MAQSAYHPAALDLALFHLLCLFTLLTTRGLRSHFRMIPVYILHIIVSRVCMSARNGSGEAFVGVVGLGPGACLTCLRRAGTSSSRAPFAEVGEGHGRVLGVIYLPWRALLLLHNHRLTRLVSCCKVARQFSGLLCCWFFPLFFLPRVPPVVSCQTMSGQEQGGLVMNCQPSSRYWDLVPRRERMTTRRGGWVARRKGNAEAEGLGIPEPTYVGVLKEHAWHCGGLCGGEYGDLSSSCRQIGRHGSARWSRH